jgi:hypothetical protein
MESVIHLPSLNRLLTGLNVGNNAQSLCPDRSGFILLLRLPGQLHHGETEEGLMAIGQSINIIGIKNSEVNKHLVWIGKTEDNILAVLIYNLTLVGHRYAQAHRF